MSDNHGGVSSLFASVTLASSADAHVFFAEYSVSLDGASPTTLNGYFFNGYFPKRQLFTASGLTDGQHEVVLANQASTSFNLPPPPAFLSPLRVSGRSAKRR